MCGIYGYIGQPADLVQKVTNALRIMEYRGHDSWGIAWDDGQSLAIRKQPGRVPLELEPEQKSQLAVGHTRWATHGRVTSANAHPHLDPAGQVGVVHNGVIENCDELRRAFAPEIFLSETDSEIVPLLVTEGLRAGFTFPQSVHLAFEKLDGSNAIVVVHRPTGQICAMTSRSPLRLGRRKGAYLIASDPLALIDDSDEIAVVPERTLVTINEDGVMYSHAQPGVSALPEWAGVPSDTHADIGDHAHFMLKEIYDQPDVLERLIACADDVLPIADAVSAHQHLLLTGCGSAYYAAALGAEWLRRAYPDVWIDVLPASEIGEHTHNRGVGTLVLMLTQSGETADIVDAIHVVRTWGATVVGFVNTESSTVATSVDICVPLLAGTERSVLATKSFLAMVMRLLQLANYLAKGSFFSSVDISEVNSDIRRTLNCESLNELAHAIGVHDHVLTLGTGPGHKVALEAALKLKEGTYAHGEAFLTGELKHGPLALVCEGTPCLLFATSPSELDGTRIASREIMSRGGETVGFGAFEVGECSKIIKIADRGPATVLVHVVTAQLLAYYIAIYRGVDPDYPRNLAKSVTVR